MDIRCIPVALLTIFSSSLSAQCTPLLSDDYSNASLWTPVVTTPGSLTISGGTMNYNVLPGAEYGRAYRPLPSSLSDTYWEASCAFMPMYGNAPGHYVMAFTAGTLDPISYDASGSYSLTNQDAIMVYYLKQGPTPTAGCCPDPTVGPWQAVIRSKKGNVLAPQSAGISILNLNQFAYVKLSRLSSSVVSLAIYSDSGMTAHLPGSPVYDTIDCGITGLNTVHQGVITWSGYVRELTAKLDNLLVCDGSSSVLSDSTYFNVCTGYSVVLNAGSIPGAGYSWSGGIACGTCPQAYINAYGSNSVYSVVINDGCSLFTKYFFVHDSVCGLGAAICTDPPVPNVFSPNNDMENDEFRIFTCSDAELQIYNRWGNLVFKTDDMNNSWNGKLKNTGPEVPEGVYYYILSQKGKTLKGVVSIVR